MSSERKAVNPKASCSNCIYQHNDYCHRCPPTIIQKSGYDGFSRFPWACGPCGEHPEYLIDCDSAKP